MDDEAKQSTKFVPEEDKKKTRGSSGMKWEDQMVNMVQELNKGMNKNSAEYKKRKRKLLKERREFIELKKMELMGKADEGKKVDGSTSHLASTVAPVEVACHIFHAADSLFLAFHSMES